MLVCVAGSAQADEAAYCVTCTGPDQTYRCRVTGEGSKPSDALKLYCVIRTAKEGHHRLLLLPRTRLPPVPAWRRFIAMTGRPFRTI